MKKFKFGQYRVQYIPTYKFRGFRIGLDSDIDHSFIEWWLTLGWFHLVFWKEMEK